MVEKIQRQRASHVILAFRGTVSWEETKIRPTSCHKFFQPSTSTFFGLSWSPYQTIQQGWQQGRSTHTNPDSFQPLLLVRLFLSHNGSMGRMCIYRKYLHLGKYAIHGSYMILWLLFFFWKKLWWWTKFIQEWFFVMHVNTSSHRIHGNYCGWFRNPKQPPKNMD